MSGSRAMDMTKKQIADFCEDVYNDDSASTKQVTDRLGATIKRHLKKLGVHSERQRVGQHSEVHYSFTKIKKDLTGDARTNAEVTEAHRVSDILRQWKDAVLSLNLPHHLIEKNLERAANSLEEYIPDFRKQMNAGLPITKLRANWKIMFKNERRGANRAAVIKSLADIRFEHHAFYLIQPVYVWARKIGTSKDKANRDRKVMNQIKVNPEFAINTAAKLIDKSLENKDKANKFDLAVALAIATGRRRTEIFKTAKFSVTATTPANHLIFNGQLKTHDRELFNDRKPYVIPCLIDREKVIEALKLLRKIQKKDLVSYLDQRGNEVSFGVLEKPYNDKYHNSAVNSYYVHGANDRIRHLFSTPLIEFRHTRDMYSEIGYDKFKNDGEGRSAYRTRVYGHAEGASEVSRAYEKFEITTDIEKASFINKSEKRTSSSANKPVVDKLTELTPKIEAYKRNPNAIRVHQWLIAQLELGLPVDTISASYIRKNIMLPDVQQLNLNGIKSYMGEKYINWDETKLLAQEEAEQEESSDEIETEIDMIECDDQDQEPEQTEPAEEKPAAKQPKAKSKHKPVFSAPKQQEDGTWLVHFVLDDVEHEVEVLQASNMREAGELGWQQWQEQQANKPRKMPKPVTRKNGSWWIASIIYKGNILAEEMCQGKESEAIAAVTAQYKEKYGN